MNRPPSLLLCEDWRALLAKHQSRVQPWVLDRRSRGSIGQKHPVYDFLFDYYSFKPSQLARWSPGIGYLVCGATTQSFPGAQDFTPIEGGIFLDVRSFPSKRIKFLSWAITYLKAIQSRAPHLGCFGLHEWAMLYRAEKPRHSSIALRLTPNEINDVCESLPIRCSHYDAFRFFTPEAKPLNNRRLSRETTSEHDQPGCIHVTMDLYRYAYKIAPFLSAELTADAFALAVKAREIDMRASPYQLTSLGFKPIPIETSAGRLEYIEIQKKLMLEAHDIRTRLIAEYQNLYQARSGVNAG